MKIIDLRSDTVTRPSTVMRQAMASAEVGDDVYGDDPTVNALQEYAAKLLGFESALFTASGTQANFVGIMSHCQRGDEYIVGQQAHTYKYEGGGAAVLGSIQPQPLEFADDGTLDLDLIAAHIKPDDFHFARTRLLCLENTQNGRALPLHYFTKARAFCETHQLNLHLDGARLFNAAVAQKVDVTEISRHFDSVSICLSKGLGAPIGSVLCGSKDLIDNARRWRKVAGGGMRQAGILAAAGLYALKNNVDRLADDHANAQILNEGLSKIEQINVLQDPAQTNMVFFTIGKDDVAPLEEMLKTNGIIASVGTKTRLVTHLDISRKDVEKVIEVITGYFEQKG
ncbi:low-specificity L-threonine aldolase [Desulfosediminicola sp.]|uniref:low-specificity L-threonine aldolase n=1 Tax=Desulfosediminicola sp. TaxID=2886825 RepID=UPI003AF27CB3